MCKKKDMIVTAEPGMIFWIKNPDYFNKEGRHLFLVISRENDRREYQTLQINSKKRTPDSLPICLKNELVSYISTDTIYSFKAKDLNIGSYYGMLRDDDFLPREEILELCMEAYIHYNGIAVSSSHYGSDAIRYYNSKFIDTYEENGVKEEKDRRESKRPHLSIDPTLPLTSKIEGLETIREMIPKDHETKVVTVLAKTGKQQYTRNFPDWTYFGKLFDIRPTDLTASEVEDISKYFRTYSNAEISSNSGKTTTQVAQKRYYLKTKGGINVTKIK